MISEIHHEGSSHFKKARYDAEECRLEVYFKNGSVYAWRDIPKDIWEEFMLSFSRGSYLHSVIEPRFGLGKKVVDGQTKEADVSSDKQEPKKRAIIS